jgi:chromate reductase, NAD(P)H dehydrogenase (quinone)
MSLRILGFAGSLRKQSLNKLLLPIVARGIEKEGLNLEIVDLGEANLPFLNEG